MGQEKRKSVGGYQVAGGGTIVLPFPLSTPLTGCVVTASCPSLNRGGLLQSGDCPYIEPNTK